VISDKDFEKIKKQAKKYPGITIRSKSSIQIAFNYKGIWHRVTLKYEATPSGLKAAVGKRASIIKAISDGTFDYAKEFPNSKHAAKYGDTCNITIEEALNKRLQWVHAKREYSTFKDYKNSILNHLIPEFGCLTLSELKVRHITSWLESKIDIVEGTSISIKRAKNLLTPLRAIFKRALSDELIKENPLDKLPDLEDILGENKSEYFVDPFDSDEQQLLLDEMKNQQIRNIYQFAFATGLRPSELIEVKWGDVNWNSKTIAISRAKVRKRVKCPKTNSGNRTIKLMSPAIEALKSQKALTFLQGEHIFHNPFSGTPWDTPDQLRKRAWLPAIRKSGLCYRNPYQTRHTYASTLLTAGEDPMWVAHQMGHKDWGVIRRVYGKWIDNMRPDAGSKAEMYLQSIAQGLHQTTVSS